MDINPKNIAQTPPSSSAAPEQTKRGFLAKLRYNYPAIFGALIAIGFIARFVQIYLKARAYLK